MEVNNFPSIDLYIESEPINDNNPIHMLFGNFIVVKTLAKKIPSTIFIANE